MIFRFLKKRNKNKSGKKQPSQHSDGRRDHKVIAPSEAIVAHTKQKPKWQIYADVYLEGGMLPPDDVLPTLNNLFLEHIAEPFELRQHQIETAISSLMERLAKIDVAMEGIAIHAPQNAHALSYYEGDQNHDL